MIHDITSTKSSIDLKSYRLYTIPGSGLEVLIISKYEQNIQQNQGKLSKNVKAAAAMAIQVGSFADPIEAQGCAHFLEHMVFMGSEKYPQENYYDNFVSTNGGSCNAFTEGDHTVYEFDIIAEYFPKALDIFAHCFISPLLSFSSATREIEAIDSEFNLASMDDDNRWIQILSHHSLNNPIMQKFSWGNAKSLVDCPKQYGINMESLLKGFHKQYYVPCNMKLVVCGPRTLDDLQGIIVDSFGDWRVSNSLQTSIQIDFSKKSSSDKRKKKKPSPILLSPLEDLLRDYADKDLFPSEHMNSLYRIIPIKKHHKLILSWQLPSTVKYYRSKPMKYIGHLLGFEGPGSILSALKRLEYSHELAAGVSGSNLEENTMFTIFSVSVKLTLKGLVNWPHVARIIHDYLSLIKNSEPDDLYRIFCELKAIDSIKYDYLDEEDEDELVERLAAAMLPFNMINREDLLSSEVVIKDWEPDIIAKAINLLTPERTRYDLLSPIFNSTKENGGYDDESDEEEDIEDDNDDDNDNAEDDDQDDDDDNDNEEEDTSSTSDNADDYGETDDHILSLLYEGPSSWKSFIQAPKSPMLIEPYFETKYAMDSLPADLKEYLSNRMNAGVITIPYEKHHTHLSLPPPNQYIPDSLHIISHDVIQRKYPELLCQYNGLKAWFLNDTERFRVPKGQIIVRIVTPISISDNVPLSIRNISDQMDSDNLIQQNDDSEWNSKVLSCILFDLSIEMLKDVLNETLYVASIAELYGEIVKSRDIGMNIYLTGFNSKSLVLLRTIIETWVALPLNYSRSSTDYSRFHADFKRSLEYLLKAYENVNIKADSAGNNARLSVLLPSIPTAQQRYDYICTHRSKFTIDLLQQYLMALLSPEYGLYIELLVQGNYSSIEIKSFIENILELSVTIPSTSHESIHTRSIKLKDICINESYPKEDVLKIPIKSVPYLHPSTRTSTDYDIKNESKYSILTTSIPTSKYERNIYVETYFQYGEYNLIIDTFFDLLDQIITEPFFDSLRTKQQLGYSVTCKVSEVKNVLGYRFIVQSSSCSIEKVYESIMRFVDGLIPFIEGLSEEEFNTHRVTTISNKLMPHNSLYEASKENWTSIECRRYDFSSSNEQAILLSNESETKFTKDTLIEFVRRVFFDERKLLTVVTDRTSGSILKG